MKLKVESLTRAPVSAAWLAYNTPAHITQWNAASSDWHSPHSEVDLRVGGRFKHRMEARDGSMGFDFEGEFIRIEPQQLIEYRMLGGRMALVQFSPAAEGTRVTVEFDVESQFPIEHQQQGWQSILDNFAQYADSLQAD